MKIKENKRNQESRLKEICSSKGIDFTQYFGLLNEDLGKVIAEGLGVPWEPVDLEGYAKTWSIASAN